MNPALVNESLLGFEKKIVVLKSASRTFLYRWRLVVQERESVFFENSYALVAAFKIKLLLSSIN
jgi:hypothetical protein